jgi:PAS domain S-box-containing protein
MPSTSSPRAEGLRDRGIDIKRRRVHAVLDDVHVGLADDQQVLAPSRSLAPAPAIGDTIVLGPRRIDVRLRLIALVLLVIAAAAAGFVLTLVDSSRDAWLVCGTGLAIAAATAALVLTRDRQRQAMTEFERYFTLAPEIVVLAGFDGYWKRVNPTVEALLGYTERDWLARPFMEFIHPDDRERSQEETRRVFAGATVRAFENRVLCKDGSHKWIEWTATPVTQGRVIYAVGRDVTERRRSEREHAALHRVATLVAQEAPEADVFGAIAEEIGGLLGTEEVRMLRFDRDTSAVVVGGSGRPEAFPLGSHQHLDGDSVALRVLRTRRPARFDDYAVAAGTLAEGARSIGVRAVVGVPVFVERRLWGAISAGSTHDGPLPPDTEARLDQFTKLMATAISNAEARAEVHRLADEQAALRRVAVLVAEQLSPIEVFTAVTQAVGLLLDADLAVLHVFPGDGTATTIASWSGDGPSLPTGTQFPLDGDNLAAHKPECTATTKRRSGRQQKSHGACACARPSGRRSSSRASSGAP